MSLQILMSVVSEEKRQFVHFGKRLADAMQLA
jgi:hypothetical protein